MAQTADASRIDELSARLESLKAEEYECPGPTREVSEEVKNAVESAINENPMMHMARCIDLHCCACEIYDAHEAKVIQAEEDFDALLELRAPAKR